MSSVINSPLLLYGAESESPCLGTNALHTPINTESLIWIKGWYFYFRSFAAVRPSCGICAVLTVHIKVRMIRQLWLRKLFVILEMLLLSFSLVRKKRKAFWKGMFRWTWRIKVLCRKRALWGNDNGKWKMDLRRGILERRLKLGKRLGKKQGVENCVVRRTERL